MPKPDQYVTLGVHERLQIARDHLRARESDHFRLSLTSDELEPTRSSRLPTMEAELERLRAVVADLEKEASG